MISSKRIKKVIVTALSTTVAISAFSAAFSNIPCLNITEEAEAAHGDNGVYFYDFEDYTAGFGDGVGPDEHIKTLRLTDGTKDWQFNYKNYGRGNDEEDGHGGVMEEKSASFPSFVFPTAITKGKMKISFDMKITDPNNKSQPAFFLYGGSGETLDRSNEMHLMWFNYGGSKEARYAKYCAAWNATNPLTGFDYDDAKQWNHYDFVFSDAASATTPTVSGYINGKLVFENTLRNSVKARSIRSFGIWMEGGDSSSRVYIDNFYAKHFMGKDVYTADSYGDSTFDLTDGRIRIAMTERSKDPVTKDNISLTNVTTGKKITNFDVTNYTGQSFDIQINGTVDYGRYDVSFKNIVGELNGSVLTGTVTAYTEYKPATVKKSVGENFNDYTAESAANGNLPDGFMCQEGENLPAVSVGGSSGQDGDYALGFDNIPDDDFFTKRAMYRFDSPIYAGGGLDITFDIFNKDATAYFYLADDSDFPDDVSGQKDYKKNALLSIDSSGKIKYASQRIATPDKLLSGVTAENGTWHKVNIKTESDTENGKSYLYISIDGGTATKVETSRRFDQNSVCGVGIGYAISGSGTPDIRIDNIDVVGNIDAYYPQVESIKAYDGLGNEVVLTGDDSAMISELKIKFNTYIDHNLDEYISVTEDDADFPLVYTVEDNTSDYTSTVSVKFENLLSGLREYKVSVDDGVPSAYSSDIKSYISYSTTINANSEYAFKCADNGYDENTGKATVVFSKNDNSSASYVYAVAGYKTVTHETEDGEVSVKRMTGMKYLPVTVKAEDMGRFEYSLEYKDNYATEYKTYLWTFPKIEKVECSEDGTIE